MYLLAGLYVAAYSFQELQVRGKQIAKTQKICIFLFFFCILSNWFLNDSTFTHLIIPYQDAPG